MVDQMTAAHDDSELLRRLDRALNDFQSTRNDFQATRDDVIALKQGYGNLQGGMVELRGSVDRLVSRFEEARRTNWPLIAVLAGMLPVLLTGTGFIMSSFTANAVAPINSAITELRSTQTANDLTLRALAADQQSQARDQIAINQQVSRNSAEMPQVHDQITTLQQRTASSLEADSASRTDRGQLNERVAKLEAALATEVADRRSDGATFGTHLGEIETQFHAVSDVGNLRGAQQERMNALLWHKAFGEDYPVGTFFPPAMFGGTPLNGH
ncbi:MAG TPA: hypothetical protein VGI28_01660 [Stellaceae bacterium]|jgi:hypothetical protein